MFSNAHNFNIEQINIQVSGHHEGALRDLRQKVAGSALLNSNERFDAARCHPGTRVAVQQDIFRFVNRSHDRPDRWPKQILWLIGPAGSGKTTIMNTVAEELKSQGNLAAAFFFSSSSGIPAQTMQDQFVTTLAYQLIQHEGIPGIRESVLSSIANDPTILEMCLKEQMEVLILQPLRKCRTPCDALTRQMIVVDGLDERGRPDSEPDETQFYGDYAQNEFLRVLLGALNVPAFPFRLIMASRPNPAIQHTLTISPELSAIEILLDHKYNPDADIRLFLTSRFAQIRRRHPHLPASWPGEAIITILVKNASQQMIYAATIIRFVESPSNHPRAQLDTILNRRHVASLPNLNPFGPLDTLYSRILSSCPDPVLVIKWLKAYRALRIEKGAATWCFNRISESSEGEIEHLFANLSAIVRISNHQAVDSANYIFDHKSFQDFLSNHSRYGAFFPVSDNDTQGWLLERFVEAFEKKRPPCPLTDDLGAQFSAYVIDLWHRLFASRAQIELHAERLSHCDAEWWLSRIRLRKRSGRGFTMFMFVVSHNKCHPLRPCLPECKHWRRLIINKWSTTDEGVLIHLPGKRRMLLDRFCIKRLPITSNDVSVTLFAQRSPPALETSVPAEGLNHLHNSNDPGASVAPMVGLTGMFAFSEGVIESSATASLPNPIVPEP